MASPGRKEEDAFVACIPVKEHGLDKTAILVVIFIFFILKTKTKLMKAEKTTKIMEKNPGKTAAGTIMQIVRIKTELSEEDMLKIARDREPQFKAIPGILQKYYVKLGPPGEYGGVYIWDSAESLKTFKESALAATIAKAYKAIEPPSVEIIDILFQLRE